MNLRAHAAGFRRWVALRRKHGRPDRVLYFDGGLGDQLLCTSVGRELQQRRRQRIWLLTSAPELFTGNPDFAAVVPYDIWLTPWLRWSGTPLQRIWYQHHLVEEGRDAPLREHVIATLCRHVGVQGRVALRPYLPAVSPQPRVPRLRPQVAVQSSCLTARYPMLNKQWPVSYMQRVVEQLTGRIDFVQIGHREDPLLHGAADRRDATSLLESAKVLAECDLFVGLVGFLMHLARAVECPAVIIYGGREVPELTGYACNLNLVSQPPCSPCWAYSRCDHERTCLTAITASAVVGAIETQLDRPPRRPLPTELTDIASG